MELALSLVLGERSHGVTRDHYKEIALVAALSIKLQHLCLKSYGKTRIADDRLRALDWEAQGGVRGRLLWQA